MINKKFISEKLAINKYGDVALVIKYKNDMTMRLALLPNIQLKNGYAQMLIDDFEDGDIVNFNKDFIAYVENKYRNCNLMPREKWMQRQDNIIMFPRQNAQTIKFPNIPSNVENKSFLRGLRK